MKKHLSTIAIAIPVAMICSCNATGDERAYDTTRPDPREPAQSAPPDSTTGVARSSGRPGVAGDTVSRSSNISAPPGKHPDPKRP
jgi:hypothetical protein